MFYEYNVYKFRFYLTFQLRADIDELNKLLRQTQRRKVQDLLSIEIRKAETELIKVKEAVAAQKASEIPSTSNSATPQKRYQMKLNGYGKTC